MNCLILTMQHRKVYPMVFPMSHQHWARISTPFHIQLDFQAHYSQQIEQSPTSKLS